MGKKKRRAPRSAAAPPGRARSARRLQQLSLRRSEEAKRKRRAASWKRWRDALRAAISTRFFRASIVVLLVGAGAVVSMAALIRSSPDRVSGSLREVESIRFTPESQPDGGISPVCGCMLPEVEDWRGVTFASRQLEISRTGQYGWTEWVGSGAEPDSISLGGLLKRLTIKVYRFDLGGEQLNPQWLVNGGLGRHASDVRMQVIKTGGFVVLTRGSLQAALFGSVPVGAYLPFPGSDVTLSYSASAFPTDPRTPTIVDHYAADVGKAALTPSEGGPKHPDEAKANQGFPIVELLGPDLVLWSDDPGTQMPGTPFASPARADEVTAIVIPGSTFATRIGIAPLPNVVENAYRRKQKSLGIRARENVLFGIPDRGRITVTLDQQLPEVDYAQMRRSVRRNPITAVKTYVVGSFTSGGKTTSLTGPMTESERYPPLPSNRGFNVFGPMSSIQFRGATGALLVRDRQVELPGPSDVVLSGVESLADQQNRQLVPLPLTTSGHAASLQFQGVSRVSVNGIDETTFWRRHEASLTAAGIVATVLGATLTVVALLRGILRREARRT